MVVVVAEWVAILCVGVRALPLLVGPTGPVQSCLAAAVTRARNVKLRLASILLLLARGTSNKAGVLLLLGRVLAGFAGFATFGGVLAAVPLALGGPSCFDLGAVGEGQHLRLPTLGSGTLGASRTFAGEASVLESTELGLERLDRLREGGVLGLELGRVALRGTLAFAHAAPWRAGSRGSAACSSGCASPTEAGMEVQLELQLGGRARPPPAPCATGAAG